jgi:hypothetical protein
LFRYLLTSWRVNKGDAHYVFSWWSGQDEFENALKACVALICGDDALRAQWNAVLETEPTKPQRHPYDSVCWKCNRGRWTDNPVRIHGHLMELCHHCESYICERCKHCAETCVRMQLPFN